MKRGGPLRRGKPLQRGGPLRRTTPLTSSRKPMAESSARGRRERAAWGKRRDAHKAAHPHCEASPTGCFRLPLPGSCWGPLDVNHIHPRGMGGTREDTSPLVSLCRRHHDWIESHREEAYALGLLAHFWDE